MKKSLGAQTLVYPTPAWIVGTYDAKGRPNGMTAAWGGICCSDPPCIAVSLRKATYSYGSLMARKAFTISVPSESQVKQADYFGLTSGRDTDKFAASSLTPVRSDLVDAPYVEQCPLVLECKVLHVFELGLHTQFVGQILDVKADAAVLDARGVPDIEKVRPILFAPGSRGYYGVGGPLGLAFAVGKEITLVSRYVGAGARFHPSEAPCLGPDL
jgi:flavin reductase (DIM6/NTAB) family NADH-FMN oxidoreductase RutF